MSGVVVAMLMANLQLYQCRFHLNLGMWALQTDAVNITLLLDGRP